MPAGTHGTAISVEPDIRIKDVRIAEDLLSVDLMDGRTISVPIAWFPRLLNGTPEQRARWEVVGAGYGIHWPDLDEDLSVAGLLHPQGGMARSASASAT